MRPVPAQGRRRGAIYQIINNKSSEFQGDAAEAYGVGFRAHYRFSAIPVSVLSG